MGEKRYVVEKVFEHKGFMCAVLMMCTGHRCGYVGVPKNHKFYGLYYGDINFIDCHGGLTYSSSDENNKYPVEEHSDLLWFGWDYAHYGDGYDIAGIIKNFGTKRAEEINRYYVKIGHPYSVYDVEYDCKLVAEQFCEEGE